MNIYHYRTSLLRGRVALSAIKSCDTSETGPVGRVGDVLNDYEALITYVEQEFQDPQEELEDVACHPDISGTPAESTLVSLLQSIRTLFVTREFRPKT